ncbi:response regulator transcription factor [Thiomicrospira microaerophila]|uniref:response regulator transcription factor n=1 Tax=Thiomicrospira microaerophila TaxID=406020 RepID=UPI0005C8BECC|nr:response regulator transcription factor [Thiomicrospira microaerophila]
MNPKPQPMGLLIVEDNTELSETLAIYMEMEGFEVHTAVNLAELEARLAKNTIDVVLLDLGLGDDDGALWLKANRKQLGPRGVIIVSARASTESRIACLNAGADSYFIKPVMLQELSLAIQNLAQRVGHNSAQQANQIASSVVEQWCFDKLHWTLTRRPHPAIKLTSNEYAVIELLADTPGEVVSRDQIIKRLGCDPMTYDVRRLEVMMRRLRVKFEKQDLTLPLDTVRGQGYVFTGELNCV